MVKGLPRRCRRSLILSHLCILMLSSFIPRIFDDAERQIMLANEEPSNGLQLESLAEEQQHPREVLRDNFLSSRGGVRPPSERSLINRSGRNSC